jgi:hypothetical protein
MTIKRRKFQLGIRLSASTSATTLEGEMRLDPSALTFRAYVDGAERDILTADQVQTVTNKVIDVDNNTISNIETDNLKVGVLVTTISAATSDTEIPSALAVKTALAGQNEASEITYDPSANPETSATDVQSALDDTGVASQAAADAAGTAQTTVDDHISDAADAHDASAISNVPAGNLAATEVQAALNELQTDIDTRALDSALTAHINDTADAHAASAISYDNATSGLTAVEVQAAIDEVEARLDTTEGVATGAAADLATHEAETTVHGVSGNVVGTSDAQVITLKDIDGGTATNTSRVTVPKATKATLDALTRKEATLVYASDEKTLYADDGTALQEIGGGGGGGLDSFYTENFEGQIGAADFTVGNDATFDNGGAFNGVFTNNTSTPISKTSCIIYTQASSSLNDFVKSPTIVIDRKQQGQTVGLTFYYNYDGDSDDIKVVGYDNTGAEVMTLASNLIKASTSSQRLSVEFPVPSDSTSISWGFQTVVENIGAILNVDDIEISTNPFVYKNLTNDTDWTDYTPTLGSGFGTTSNLVGKYRQVGDSIEISAYFTAGTVAASLCSISLPSGLSIDTSKLTIVGNTTAAEGSMIGFWEVTEAAANSNGKLITAPSTDSTLLYFGQSSINAANGLIPANGIAVMASSTDMNVILTVPIEGWTAESEHVVAYNSRNAENSMVRLHTGNGHGSTNNKIRRFTTAVTNVGNAITYTDSAADGATFTIEEDGVYNISYSDNMSAAAWVGLSLNSSQLSTSIPTITIGDILDVDYTATGTGNASATWSGELSRGDIVRPHTDGVSGGASPTTFTISKIGVGDLMGVPVPRTAYIKDVKASGTAGGTFTNGAWRTRDLNTLSGDAEFVSLSSNQFTLQPGKYAIDSRSSVFGVDANTVKLRNITNSLDTTIGLQAYSPTSGGSLATLNDTIEVLTPTTFEIQHQGQATRAGNGFGVNSSFGVDEVYTVCKITKVS